jgi:hypothetical protein
VANQINHLSTKGRVQRKRQGIQVAWHERDGATAAQHTLPPLAVESLAGPIMMSAASIGKGRGCNTTELSSWANRSAGPMKAPRPESSIGGLSRSALAVHLCYGFEDWRNAAIERRVGCASRNATSSAIARSIRSGFTSVQR